MVIKLPEISIVIVGYRAKKYLDACLKSIRHQTIYSTSNIEVIYIDNASFDQSVAHLQRNYKWVSTVRNMKNAGFAKALNQGVKYASGEYVLVMNPDVILEKDYLEVALKKMKHDRHVAALGGKIFRYDFNTNEKTPYFDTVGIFAYVNREILSARGAKDVGQFEKPQEIFSVRNICAFYRKAALEDVKILKEYFDSGFLLYLEDVDICWRLHLYGWKVEFMPELVSSHIRSTRKKATLEKSKKVERRAFIINERLMMIKNEFILNIIKDLPQIISKRIRKSFFREMWLKGWRIYIFQSWKALRQRRQIMAGKRVSRFDMRRWFVGKRSLKFKKFKSQSLDIYAKLPPTY